MNALNNMYLTGKNSLHNNLPMPVAVRLDDFHGYISLWENIVSILSFDLDYEMISTHNYVHDDSLSQFNDYQLEDVFTNYLDQYLLLFGMNQRSIDDIIEKEGNIKAYALSKDVNNTKESNMFEKLKKNPELFMLMPSKALWT